MTIACAIACAPLKPCCAKQSTGRRRRRTAAPSPAISRFAGYPEPLEWLQWVLIPRMHQLLESGQPLPQNFAVTPYYEMALDQAHPVRESMLAELLLLDALFAGEQA